MWRLNSNGDFGSIRQVFGLCVDRARIAEPLAPRTDPNVTNLVRASQKREGSECVALLIVEVQSRRSTLLHERAQQPAVLVVGTSLPKLLFGRGYPRNRGTGYLQHVN